MCVGYTLIYAILYKGPGTNPQRMQRDDCINFSKVVMVCVCMPKKKKKKGLDVLPPENYFCLLVLFCVSPISYIEGVLALKLREKHY